MNPLHLKNLAKILSLAWLILSISGIAQAAIEERETTDWTSFEQEGEGLSETDARKLEEQLQVDPENLAPRAKLLGYYFLKMADSVQAREARQAHCLWIIENRPESNIASDAYIELDPQRDRGAYSRAKKLWLQNIQARNGNLKILRNAAKFFLRNDSALAEDLLKKAQALEPDNPDWNEKLGELYNLDDKFEKSLAQYEEALKKTDRSSQWTLLEDASAVAFEAGMTETAQVYATELLKLAANEPRNWDYENAFHHGNIILGRVALKSGNMDEARERLLKAGRVRGSPQLSSFGPNMSLAKDLLEKGEKETVLKYFALCGVFWKSGKADLETWTADVNDDKMPRFGANLHY